MLQILMFLINVIVMMAFIILLELVLLALPSAIPVLVLQFALNVPANILNNLETFHLIANASMVITMMELHV